MPVIVLGQHTFSIVAVDSATGQVGSAGATCLEDTTSSTGGAVIISDVKPGRGAIHTQASYLSFNQQAAGDRMDMGDSPEEIISFITKNDFFNDSTVRQYGIADFDSSGSPRTSAFTGDSTLDYHGHIVGPNYAIQGNILLGPGVLDSMEARFLATKGSLADKLMAALQGAKRPGADSRCLQEGVSSQSAFLRVANPGDQQGSISLDLVVSSTPFGEEPIDSLYCLFRKNQGLACDTLASDTSDTTTTSFTPVSPRISKARIIPNPANSSAMLQLPVNQWSGEVSINVFNAAGKRMVALQTNRHRVPLQIEDFTEGLYFYVVHKSNQKLASGTFVVH